MYDLVPFHFLHLFALLVAIKFIGCQWKVSHKSIPLPSLIPWVLHPRFR